MAIRLVEPFYRNAIFATQKIEKVVTDVEVNLEPERLKGSSLHVAIRKRDDGREILSRTVPNPRARTRVEFPCAELPEGAFEIAAVLKDHDGKLLAECRHPLDKLPYRENEVWLGRDLIWRVDGKKFFPVGAWGKCESEYANVGLGGELLAPPLKTIACFYWSGTTSNVIAFDDWVQDYTRKQIRRFRDEPDVFAYFIADEPECKPFPKESLEGCYRIMREEDPYHPVLISNDSIEGGLTYAKAADFNISHPYPTISMSKRINDLGKIRAAMENYLKVTGRRKQVGFMHQGFNYGDFNQTDGRVPNYPELRAQHLLAVTCGARSILMFNPRDLQAGYPELYIGVPHLVQELAFLGQIVLAQESGIKPTASAADVTVLAREMAGDLYLFVSNASNEPGEIEIALAGSPEKPARMHVISEEREVTLRRGRLRDRFDTWESHVYTTAAPPDGLLSVRAICGKIADANAARRKPGNLAFQMFNGDGVVVTASSRYPGTENALWHVVDGIINRKDHYRKLTWSDHTPDTFPDWLEIRLPEKHDIARVVVHPMEKSLKDYEIRAFVGEQWKTVDKVGGQSADTTVHRFPTVRTDRIRIRITAANGPSSRISEVEIYGK